MGWYHITLAGFFYANRPFLTLQGQANCLSPRGDPLCEGMMVTVAQG